MNGQTSEWSGQTPYEFDINSKMKIGSDKQDFCESPILGAIISATPDLIASVSAVKKAGKDLRKIIEALCLLPESQKNAYAPARGVIKVARSAGKDVKVVDGE